MEYPADRQKTAIESGVISSSKLIYEETFEGSTSFSSYVGKQIGTSYGFTVTTSPAFAGSKAGRFELHDSDPMTSSGTRAEIKFPPITNPDRWYSFSVYFPGADYQYDSEAEIISQWHQGGGVSPSISLITRYNKLVIESRSVPTTKTQYPLGDLVKDKWQTYVLHIVHSHGSNGVMEIWRDGEMIFTHNGPNSYEMTTGKYDNPTWKIGLYKWDWNGTGTTDVKKRVIYFDNVRLGSESATYNDMVSEGSVIPPITTPITTPVTIPTTNTNLAISSFTLINSSTEDDVATIKEGGTYSLKQLGLTKVNIRANASTNAGSVKMELTGRQSRNFIDDVAPFSLMGDDEKGNYYSGIWGPPRTGAYTLKATPYSLNAAKGTVGTGLTIHFTIAN